MSAITFQKIDSAQQHALHPLAKPTDQLLRQATYYGGRQPEATVATPTSGWLDAATAIPLEIYWVMVLFIAALVEAFIGFFPAAYESLTTHARKLFS